MKHYHHYLKWYISACNRFSPVQVCWVSINIVTRMKKSRDRQDKAGVTKWGRERMWEREEMKAAASAARVSVWMRAHARARCVTWLWSQTPPCTSLLSSSHTVTVADPHSCEISQKTYWTVAISVWSCGQLTGRQKSVVSVTARGEEWLTQPVNSLSQSTPSASQHPQLVSHLSAAVVVVVVSRRSSHLISSTTVSTF